jgi:large subunit ribosomal protein L18
MGKMNPRALSRLKRKKRIRKKVFGTPDRPRLSVFRSAKHIYAQIVDDTAGQTISSASTLDETVKSNTDIESKVAAAQLVGKLVAERALEKGIKQVVFDRNGFLYHGRIKAISDGAREAGLGF